MKDQTSEIANAESKIANPKSNLQNKDYTLKTAK
jgi:hypothetical protein